MSIKSLRVLLPVFVLFFNLLTALAQTSGEAAVVESVSRQFTFADSGASTTSVQARIQIKTSAGVQRTGCCG